MQITPVMPLRMLLHAIPANIEVAHLHTDMQGFDFVAIKSTGKSLTRVKSVQVEWYFNDKTEYNIGNITTHFKTTLSPIWQSWAIS